ncbi:hypothetical protein [Muribacter muris]|uniref:hypothetical protein n=1 Tax=Muribacter muris TaxID=67855 RepID=UPI00069E2BBB|nr:hypothetical protein [Muribacter muris]
MPWDNKDNEPNLQLSKIEQLMPYHSYISPQVVTTTLNKMLKWAEQVDTIFYEIYSKAEKRKDPSKQHTGIFVFNGKPNAPFAIIAQAVVLLTLVHCMSAFRSHNLLLMLYTGHSDYNRQGEPATFVAIGEQDGTGTAAEGWKKQAIKFWQQQC